MEVTQMMHPDDDCPQMVYVKNVEAPPDGAKHSA